MSFNFLDPTNVDRNMFLRCVRVLSGKNGIELHMLNDAVLKEYEKNINEQQKRYKKWLSVNLETVKSIANLLNELKNKYDNKKKY